MTIILPFNDKLTKQENKNLVDLLNKESDDPNKMYILDLQHMEIEYLAYLLEKGGYNKKISTDPAPMPVLASTYRHMPVYIIKGEERTIHPRMRVTPYGDRINIAHLINKGASNVPYKVDPDQVGRVL